MQIFWWAVAEFPASDSKPEATILAVRLVSGEQRIDNCGKDQWPI